jgi:2-keto-4-pentenoate hydratase
MGDASEGGGGRNHDGDDGAQARHLAQSVLHSIDNLAPWEWAARGHAASIRLERAYDVQAAVKALREARGEQVAGFKVTHLPIGHGTRVGH